MRFEDHLHREEEIYPVPAEPAGHHLMNMDLPCSMTGTAGETGRRLHKRSCPALPMTEPGRSIDYLVFPYCCHDRTAQG